MEESAEPTLQAESPSTAVGKMLFWYDDFDQAIPWLEHAARWSEERGDEVGVAVAEFHLMMLEWFSATVMRPSHPVDS